MLILTVLLSSIFLGSTASLDIFPRCDGLIEPSVLSIDKPLENIKANRGESIVLKCAFYSSPQPSVNWYRGSKLVDSHQAPHFESLLTTNQLGQTIFESTFRIDCLDESTAGEYFCEATTPCSKPVVTSSLVTIAKTTKFARNSCSSASSSMPSLPPFISAFTLSRIEIPGGVTQLACRTRGQPAPIITWRKIEEDESLSPLVDKALYMQLHNGDLLVVGDESSISESFRCSAANEHGVVHADATVIYMSP